MTKDISELNLDNCIDIVYVYHNVKRNPDLLSVFPLIKMTDARTLPFLCMRIVEVEILNELNINDFQDKEMMDLMKNTLLKGVSEPELPEKFFCMNLPAILSPLVDKCGKNVVDMVNFVFIKSGICHFDFLFSTFKSPIQQLELHLLLAKTLKPQSFDLTDIKKCLSGSLNHAYSEEVWEDSSPQGESDTDSESNEAAAVIFESDITEKDTDSAFKPSQEDSVQNKQLNMSRSYHLAKAKEIFLSLKDGYKMRHLAELVSAYLKMHFDLKMASQAYMVYKRSTGMNVGATNKLPNVYLLNADAIQAHFSDFVSSLPKDKLDPYNPQHCLIEVENEFEDKPRVSLLSILLQISYDIIGENVRFFGGTEIFFENPKLLKCFMTAYNPHTFFSIFAHLLNEILDSFNWNSIKPLIDLGFFLDVFYDQEKMESFNKDGSPSGTELDYSILNEFGMARLDPAKKPGSLHSNHFKNIIQGLVLPGCEEYGKLSEELFIETLKNPNMFEDREKKMADHILASFKRETGWDSYSKVKEFLDRALLKMAGEVRMRIYLLNAIEIIHKHTKGKNPDDIVFDAVLKGVLTMPDINWRYRLAVLEKIDILTKLGVEKEWFRKTFENDHAYLIRERARLLLQ